MHTIKHNNTNGKQDLKDYSDNELSLLVFNDEYLYNIRKDKELLFSVLEEMFDYTDDQETVLLTDLILDEDGE